MISEDYKQYYIQGSDHYLLPANELNKLCHTITNLSIKLEDKAYEELKVGYMVLQQRISKAKQYVNNYANIDTFITYEQYKTELLQILDGK